MTSTPRYTDLAMLLQLGYAGPSNWRQAHLIVTVSIDYQLVGTGWSTSSIDLDGKAVEITGSYLSDCLGGLADAAVQLLQGAASARCSFDEEPGEYRRIIDCTDGQVRDESPVTIQWRPFIRRRTTCGNSQIS